MTQHIAFPVYGNDAADIEAKACAVAREYAAGRAFHISSIEATASVSTVAGIPASWQATVEAVIG